MPILMTTTMVLIFWAMPSDAYDYDPAAVAQEFTECAGIFQAIAESQEYAARPYRIRAHLLARVRR